MFSFINPQRHNQMDESKYEYGLSRKQRHGVKLTPDEVTRLAAAEKRFRRDILKKLGLFYAITFPFLGIFLYGVLHQS